MLYFTVRGQSIEVEREKSDLSLVASARDFVRFSVTFSEEWEGYTKCLQFSRPGVPTVEICVENEESYYIPAEILAARGSFYVTCCGVRGAHSYGVTNRVRVDIPESAVLDAQSIASADASPTLLAQFLESLEERAESLELAALSFRQNGTHLQWKYASQEENAYQDLVSLAQITGPQGIQGIQGEQGEQGEQGIQGEMGELADGDVTADKLAQGAVTSAKLADGAVTSQKLANNSVTNDKLGSGSVTYRNLTQDSVLTGHIMDGAVTAEKLSPSILSAIGGAYTVDSWAGVKALCDAGAADKAFYPGDQLQCKRGSATLTWDVVTVKPNEITLLLHDLYCRMPYSDAATNTYADSNVKAFLESDAASGFVYQESPIASDVSGFQYGLDADFLSVVANSECQSGSTTLTGKFYLPSQVELYGGEHYGVSEGEAFGLYSALAPQPFTTASPERVKYKASNGDSSIYFTRTANTNGTHVQTVLLTGEISAIKRAGVGGVCPACQIKGDA